VRRALINKDECGNFENIAERKLINMHVHKKNKALKNRGLGK